MAQVLKAHLTYYNYNWQFLDKVGDLVPTDLIMDRLQSYTIYKEMIQELNPSK